MMGQQRHQQDSTREGDILRMCPEIYLLPSSSLPDQTTEHLPRVSAWVPVLGSAKAKTHDTKLALDLLHQVFAVC